MPSIFGIFFTAVSDFTHVMETLLDEMRDGRRQITQAAVDVLLGSVDCLREMLSAIQDENDIDEQSPRQMTLFRIQFKECWNAVQINNNL
jgi:chemotaxis protein histidine kinase CheA